MSNIKILILVAYCAIMYCTCATEPKLLKTEVLTELTNPHEIISDDKHLVISDGIEGTTIYIYTLNDLSLYSNFGGTGDTTGKYIVSGGHQVGIDLRNDTLLISSHWKASLLTKKGELIQEFPIKQDTYKYNFLKNQFTGEDDTTVNDVMYYTFNLYDSTFNFVKEITRIAGSNQGKNGLQVLVRKYQGITYKNKYYFKGKSEEFEIEVYDLHGNKENVFTTTIDRVPVGDKHRNDVLSMYKEHPLFGQFFDAIKKRIVFPRYLPAIYNLNIADDFIYVLTYDFDRVNTVLYKLNLKGKLIEKFNTPLKWKRSTEPYPFTISNGHLYQVVKNGSEKWEIRIIEL